MPSTIHQKRLVRIARASVHSMAAQAGSTTFDVLRVASAPAVRDAPSGSKPMSSGLRRTSSVNGPMTRSTSSPMVEHDARQPSRPMIVCSHGSKTIAADTGPGERDADGQAAAANEPVRQEEGMRRVGHEACADGDHDTERCIELPRLLDRWCQ